MARLPAAITLALALCAPPLAIAADGGPLADAGPAVVEPPAPALPADRIPTVSLSVEPDEVAVGEIVRWRLTVKRRPGDRIHLPSGASFGELEVQGKEVTTGEERDGWIEERFEVRLIPFVAGDHELPSQTLSAVDIEGRVAEIETGAARVLVKSLIANEPEPELKEDTGPGERVFEKDYTLLVILAVIAGIGLVVLLTLLGLKLWELRRPRRGPPPPPPRPAEEIALEKLEALREAGLLEVGEHKEYHVRLSEAVREYLGNRYGFDSLERSTEELIWELGRVTLDAPLYDRVSLFLEETDLVKFAKMVPSLDESRGLLDGAFDLIVITTPKSEPASGGDPPKPLAKAGHDDEGNHG